MEIPLDIMEGWPCGYGACHYVDPSILEQVRDSPGDAILSITIRYRAKTIYSSPMETLNASP